MLFESGDEFHLHSSSYFSFIVMRFSYTSHAGLANIFSYSDTCWIQPGRVLLLYCSCNDYTEAIPDIILRPNKDVRARSDRLQLGTAHIQSFTQTRQMSVVMGMTRFLAAIGS